VNPGQTQLTLMPAFAPSSAMHFVSMTAPALDAQ
jgi:hypothetical protein